MWALPSLLRWYSEVDLDLFMAITNLMPNAFKCENVLKTLMFSITNTATVSYNHIRTNTVDKYQPSKHILDDLKVLRRSPDHLYNVKILLVQLQLIMEQILFYHIWGLQPFWSSDQNNLMNNPSNSPVISEKKMFRFVAKWVALDKGSQVSLTFGT